MPPTPDHDRPDLYRFLVELGDDLAGAREVAKAVRAALRASVDFFAADEGVVALRRRGASEVTVDFALPRQAGFDLATLDAFIARRYPAVPHDQILAPLRRRGLPWGVLALRRRDRAFAPGDGRALARVTALVGSVLAEIDRQRLLEVRERIDRKLMEELRPKDLFYQILHGLRSLTAYDHSSALLVADGDDLRLVAEQIAWRKRKSDRVGLRLPLDDEARRALGLGQVQGFDRTAGGWVAWRGHDPVLARLLDDGRYRTDPDEPAAGALLAAPLVTGDGLFGVLKVAGRLPATFGPYDAELLDRFVPQAAIAIQNARRAASLEHRMLAAERKHVMAELARGVSHDVNNALGSVLPLVQQIQADLSAGAVDPKVLADDLAQILTSLRVCRRIFGGMLAFARGAERRLGPADPRPALKNALAVLEDGMTRRGIALRLDLPERLPAVAGCQGDLEQVFLNLLTNARDAMPAGGTLTVRAGHDADHLTLAIEDTGTGIPEEILGRIQEPFFSTKPDGNGLGLAICRSIVWELGGDMAFDSRPGIGTRVLVRLPLIGPGRREET
jgi:signal transduction histidine kinase